MNEDELKLQKLRYAKEEELCPECCSELEYVGYHERDSTYDKWVCPKCKWDVYVSTLEKLEEIEYTERN